MTQFFEFFRFELTFRAKSVSTYVYFLMWLAFAFFCVASESFGPVGSSNGKVLLNGAYANTFNDIYCCLFGVIVIAAIFGTSILRDFQRDMVQILFTKPLSKGAYLGGRWLGSVVTTLFAFSGVLFGAWLGTLAPWADHARIGPNHLWWYLQPFLTIVIVQIFFLGSLFFAVAALTRRLFIVYLQGVAVFMVYLIGVTVFFGTRSLEHFWSGILDPVGVMALYAVTRYWSVLEKNTLMLPLDFSGYSPGVFLYNRVLWLGVGMAALLAVWSLFPMSVEALTARQSKRAAKVREQQEAGAPHSGAPRVRSLVSSRLPRVTQIFGAVTTVAQYLALSRLRITTVVREIPFWAIVGLLIVFAINNGYFAGKVGGENVWPVTYLMVQAVEGGAALFFYIVAGLYAAELVWRERDNRFDGIHDALPLAEATDWLSKLTAIAFVEFVLLTVTMLVGMGMQTLAGYTHYEVYQYVKELYFIVFPQVVAFAMFAMFVQTLVSNKFVGHGIVIGVFVLQPVLFNFGWENTLYLPGALPAYIYSDMNGYGHYVAPITWGIVYWSSIFAVLGVISIALTRRGAEEGLRTRARLARSRVPRLAPLGGALALVAIGAGGWFYYNAHVLNEYLTADDRRRIQADYEREFKQYELKPQPKVTAVDATVDIDPAHRGFSGKGRYTLQNKTAAPIAEIHVTDIQQSVSHVSFDRPFRVVRRAPRDLYTIYALDEPLAPGEVLTMTFDVGHQSPGFRDGNELGQFAYNGTFFDADFFPVIGYSQMVELDDPRRRREQHLGPLPDMAPRGDEVHSRRSLFTPNSDWITFHAVVSTSDDQIAIAPGYLQREWRRAGRHYYEYSMDGTHILDFYAFLSGRYTVRHEVYAGVKGPVNLEVYYDPAHSYDVDAMLAASRAGLRYYEANFSPFQFNQYRILEYPRYRTFAQSFPNTVPFSEALGFIMRMEKPTDVDLTTFVTAHELGHQWWAHQLIGGEVQGSNMMSETLAQYSAYMVMQQKYGKDYMHRVLRHFLDAYLRGRSNEVRHERPLALVERESYVWYEKGGQIMYTLADTIGEDKVNLALHNFLMQYRYANAGNQTDAARAIPAESRSTSGEVPGMSGDAPRMSGEVLRVSGEAGATSGGQAVGQEAEQTADQPYPDTRQLIDALRAQTPPEYQYLIDDGFNRIVLYDNKALSATYRRTPAGKYEVTVEVQARKSQVDADGNETRMPLADYIEIGVFSGKKDEEKPLYLEKKKMTQDHAIYTVLVDDKPTRAGIDPYNKLIDRIADDNEIEVTEK